MAQAHNAPRTLPREWANAAVSSGKRSFRAQRHSQASKPDLAMFRGGRGSGVPACVAGLAGLEEECSSLRVAAGGFARQVLSVCAVASCVAAAVCVVWFGPVVGSDWDRATPGTRSCVTVKVSHSLHHRFRAERPLYQKFRKEKNSRVYPVTNFKRHYIC